MSWNRRPAKFMVRVIEGTAMVVTEEFLVLPVNEGVRIHGVHDFPSGTFVGRDAQRLRVVGPVWVKPPLPELTHDQWEKWQDQLRAAGFTVTVGPFWTSSPGGRSQPLEDVLDELLRSVN